MGAGGASAQLVTNAAHNVCTAPQETLTGFKWLANHALRLEAAGYHVLLAYEEAIGALKVP